MTPAQARALPTLRFVGDDDAAWVQDRLTASGYDVSPSRVYDPQTVEQVEVFQLQHIDWDRRPLASDGVVGPRTRWALAHSSGNAQRSHLTAIAAGHTPHGTDGLTRLRMDLLTWLYSEHSRDVRELPDGSNRSPIIDGYWGNTGLIGLPWCAAFVSHALHSVLGSYPIGGTHHVGVQRMFVAARELGMLTMVPKPCDVFIQMKAGGQGHTGFVVGVGADRTTIYTCEGNCGNRLKLGRRQSHTIDYFLDVIQDGQGENFPRGADHDFASVGNDGDR